MKNEEETVNEPEEVINPAEITSETKTEQMFETIDQVKPFQDDTADKSKDWENNLTICPSSSGLIPTISPNNITSFVPSTSLDLYNSKNSAFNSALSSPNSITSLVPSTSMDLTDSKNFAVNSASRTSPDSVKWKCEACEATIPWGMTLDQALHIEKHKKKKDSLVL